MPTSDGGLGSVDLDEHIEKQIDDFRRQLLGLTLRNPLLSCPHGQNVPGQIRIVHELHDEVFSHFDRGEAFEVTPLPEPLDIPDDEEDEEFQQALANHKKHSLAYELALKQINQSKPDTGLLEALDREVRDLVRIEMGRDKWQPQRGLSPEELAVRHGIDPSFDLSSGDAEERIDRYYDDALQTLLDKQDLARRLRLLSERARSDLRDRGVHTLFAAFGFLEWYEDPTSQRPHLAPLVLVPVELERVSRHNRRSYVLRQAGEQPIRNAALAEDLSRRFDLELPSFDPDDTPESYFEKIDSILGHERRWRIRRFLTVQIFSDAKFAIYGDLASDAWPEDAPLSQHRAVRQLMSEIGVVDVPYADDHDIDGDRAAVSVPALICDADSSQHSAIVDAMRGGNWTIYGPPGTGKSQTITNLIAAAMDAGKSVLFVAEKLTALDVVHKRLSEAALDPYCFVLHSRGVRRGAVLDALRERVQTAAPNFDEATYQERRTHWEIQRDALKLYASVMGDCLGALEFTVHEVLWKEISLRERSESLPRSVATVRLPEARVLALTENDLRRIQSDLDGLASAHRALGEPGVHPWRGIEGQELAPTELEPTCHRLVGWRAAVGHLVKASCLCGVIEPVSLESIAEVKRATALLVGNEDLTHKFDLEPLAGHDARLEVIAAADAARAASQHAQALREKFELDPSRLPLADDVRAMANEAMALECVQIPASELRGVAERERRKADNAVRVRSALEKVYRLLDISECDTGAAQIAVRALERIRLTPRPLLIARTDCWVEERAHERLTVLRTSVQEVRQEHQVLAQRFDMQALPPAEDIRAAGRRLETARWLWRLSRKSRHAAGLHKGIVSEPRRSGARSKAADLLRLAEHANAVESLKDDEGGKALMGAAWRGVDSDLGEALEVSGWAAAVATEFAGIGAGRAEVRHKLLYGDIDVLDEVANIAAGLDGLTIGDFVGSEGIAVSDPDELYALANRAEALAARVEQSGLPQDRPLSDLEDIAESIERYRGNLDAASECPILKRQDNSPADIESLPVLVRLSLAIEQVALSEEACRAALTMDTRLGFDTHTGWMENVEEAIDLENRAWRAWADPLEVEETVFFDGLTRQAAPLEALQRRADECLNRGKTVLEWCRYRRKRREILDGEARPVLVAFEQDRTDIGQSSLAFELAVYRSLASIVFRDHPSLQLLSGEQLRNHKEAFKDVEEELQELERLRIAHELHRRPVEHGISVGPQSVLTERALINQQLALKRGSVPPRELMQRAGKAMQQLKPCFMMSPTTVAELLPRTTGLFDLVVIDEASQVLPADALGAIARGKNAIVVGDPQQLPPTTFFQGGQAAGDGDGLAAASESILDLAMSAWRPHRYLRWHYRSRHSALIQFSNAKFYQNRMIVFPSPYEDRGENGVNFRYIQDGIYRGDRTNEHEVDKIIEAVLRFTSNRDNWEQSLAIVTMNQPQRDLLDEALDKAATESRSLAGYMRRWDSTLEPLTVKNLETVQGDERDVIFISTVYGPRTGGGPVSQTFGPITQQGGERRLNVLFTRARWRVDVFSSMRADDIQRRPGQSKGVQILRDYLEYAATGRIESGVATGMPTESPFEQHVKERVEAAGYDVTPQVGVASYRIDLGVKHRDYPHGFILGVECDGATYHSAKSVRDRDRLREAVLRDLGWDIYRIWSTDWFDDPDREMQKLIDYLNNRLAKLNSEQEAQDPDLAGTVVDETQRADVEQETPDEAAAFSAERAKKDALSSEADVVEVGDTVHYRRDVAGSDIRSVVIVDGADDPSAGLINDTKPLARAVLGRSRGETVTVRQPNSRVEIIIERIVKGRPQSDADVPDPVQSELFAGPSGVQPYVTWRGTTPDPRAVPTRDLANALTEIVETEGPMVTERIYRVYTRASSLQKAGRHVKRALNRALRDLERRRIVTIDREGPEKGYARATVRLADKPQTVLRDRGDRDFGEIPIDELAQMYRLVRSENSGEDEEAIRRELLTRYGLIRMTASVRERLSKAAQWP